MSTPRDDHSGARRVGLREQTDVRGTGVEDDLHATRVATKNRLQLTRHGAARLAGHRLFQFSAEPAPLWKQHADTENLRKDVTGDQRSVEVARQLRALANRLLGAWRQVRAH